MGFNIIAPYMVCVTHKWISPSLRVRIIVEKYVGVLVDFLGVLFFFNLLYWYIRLPCPKPRKSNVK